MTPAPHHTNTRTLNAPAGWNQAELPVNALPVTDGTAGDDNAPAILSYWKPDAAELALLNAGGLVCLTVLGAGMPPVSLQAWQEPVTATPKPKGGDLARLAGIWCNDPDFQKWIMATDALSARKKICLKCGITSRAELDHNRQAAQYFHRLIREPYRRYLQQQQKAST